LYLIRYNLPMNQNPILTVIFFLTESGREPVEVLSKVVDWRMKKGSVSS
jgi:hypothetical protein